MVFREKYVFDIEPQQQERPRFAKRGNYVKVYDPIRTANYKKQLRMIGENIGNNISNFDEKAPIRLEITFYRQIPKNAPKWQKRFVKTHE
ncbi:RusA family crossover junction endodeoxyribonuclease [Weissella diestrammenae]|uniref:RusA family crossover junction endodeoxyribonuclease n=1 Tax=Weissella diestrammenae TaxID=1162633 RepID=A0A7G9T4H1_9LACO|nr:RusA family crossover junction endodeoxyribonuclease [Weissella diestrammenae]QNN74996.1 RusA family crossover junction endodeoxyribonuclease [Weissella diestrammenae]